MNTRRRTATAAALVLGALNLLSLDYPYTTAELQKAGWPLIEEGRALSYPGARTSAGRGMRGFHVAFSKTTGLKLLSGLFKLVAGPGFEPGTFRL